MAIPVLTYHATNIDGNDYADNDHVALEQDLRLIDALGWRILPLHRVVELHLAGRADETRNAVALSFDDGSHWDWYDIHHHRHGRQRSLAGILRDFRAETGRPDVHATAFVIASPQARQTLDRTCLLNRGWWTDEWWPQAKWAGIAIENHSWDHNHDTLETTAQRHGRKGEFFSIETYEECDIEVRQAADYIDSRIAPDTCRLFAYPYGHYSEYLAEEYFPSFMNQHRQLAAFTTIDRPVTNADSRWCLPRYVCGWHWHSPMELEALLYDSQVRDARIRAG